MGAIFYKRLNPLLKALLLFVMITCAIEITARILFEMRINNMYLFHAYSFIEFVFISFIYFKLTEKKYWSYYILITFISFQLFSTINLLVYEDSRQFNSMQRLVEGGVLMSFFVGFIHRYSLQSKSKRKYLKPFFWLTYGFIIYFVGTIFLFAFANEILKDTSNDFWTLHGVFNIFLNGIYAAVLFGGARGKVKN